ncbi:MAG: hypothetical protein ACLPWS_04240 [Rhodomicrobium sp.]
MPSSGVNGAVVPKSKKYERVGTRGWKSGLYIDLANIRCGDWKKNTQNIFNRWGDYHDGEEPHPRKPMASTGLDEFLEDADLLNACMRRIAGAEDLGNPADMILIPDASPVEI